MPRTNSSRRSRPSAASDRGGCRVVGRAVGQSSFAQAVRSFTEKGRSDPLHRRAASSPSPHLESHTAPLLALRTGGRIPYLQRHITPLHRGGLSLRVRGALSSVGEATPGEGCRHCQREDSAPTVRDAAALSRLSRPNIRAHPGMRTRPPALRNGDRARSWGSGRRLR